MKIDVGDCGDLKRTTISFCGLWRKFCGVTTLLKLLLTSLAWDYVFLQYFIKRNLFLSLILIFEVTLVIISEDGCRI